MTPEGLAGQVEDRWRGERLSRNAMRAAIADAIRAALTEAAGRCLVTGNLWGTDTRPAGKLCDCTSCRAWLATVAIERESCAKVAEAVAEECYQHAGSLYSTAGGARCEEVAALIRARR